MVSPVLDWGESRAADKGVMKLVPIYLRGKIRKPFWLMMICVKVFSLISCRQNVPPALEADSAVKEKDIIEGSELWCYRKFEAWSLKALQDESYIQIAEKMNIKHRTYRAMIKFEHQSRWEASLRG